jgi:hypothetical protein
MDYGPEMFMDARCNHVSEKPASIPFLISSTCSWGNPTLSIGFVPVGALFGLGVPFAIGSVLATSIEILPIGGALGSVIPYVAGVDCAVPLDTLILGFAVAPPFELWLFPPLEPDDPPLPRFPINC